MNYIKELNAFREWLLINELPVSAVSLWYTLMSINNVARWRHTFNAPNGVLQQLSGLSKSGVYKARNILIEHELIKCENGQKGRAPIYEMLSLVQTEDFPVDPSVDQPVDPSVDLSVDPSVTPSGNKSWTIHKHKQKKELKRIKEEERGHILVSTYEQNIGKLSPITKEEFGDWVAAVGEEVMLEAIKLTSKHNGRTFRYLEKILTEWKEAKIETVEAVIAYQRQKESAKNNTISFKKSSKNKSLFDELRAKVGG